MTAVQIEEPKEFSWCPRQMMMQTEDGVTSGSERLIIGTLRSDDGSV